MPRVGGPRTLTIIRSSGATANALCSWPDKRPILEAGSKLGSENRKHDRVYSRLRCWCEGEDVTVYARIGNLSEGGLFLRTSTPLQRGALAVLRFGVGESEEIEARGLVVWARNEGEGGPPGMGLMFQDMDDAKLRAIRKIISGERRAMRKPGDGSTD